MPQPPTGPSLSGSRARSAFVTERGPGLNRLAVMQPIDLGSGEDPILDLDRCGALSRLGQIVQRDHCIAQRLVINQYVAVYERRWLACVGIDFIFIAAHVLSPIVMVAIAIFRALLIWSSA